MIPRQGVKQMGTKQANIVERWLFKGQLVLISPLIIGDTENILATSDLPVLKDEEGRPFIPSSSITGALKHAFEEYQYQEETADYKINKARFWGGDYKLNGKKHISQSAFIIGDLPLSKASKSKKISIRDGIKINPITGLVDEKKKYNYELVEPGAVFDFNMEIILRNSFDKKLFDAFVRWVGYMLQNGQLALGAKTNQGFGKCRLEKLQKSYLDYSQQEDVVAWLTRDYSWEQVPEGFFIINDFQYSKDVFSIKAEFKIKDGIIIGSYPGTTTESDKIHLESQNQAGQTVKVVPGTAIKGTIRSRAEKIANTLGFYDQDTINGLFGWADDEEDKSGRKQEPIKSKIKVEESQLIEDSYTEETQYRIRIDRFTGGVINNALFDSTPIWSKKDSETNLVINLSINGYEKWEAGLMLLVLKDLWNQDLPIGGEKNIGRGVLIGKKAIVKLNDKEITIKTTKAGQLAVFTGDKESWEQGAADELENLVQAFHQKIKEKGVSSNAAG